MSSVNKFYDMASLAEASYVLFNGLDEFSDTKVLDAIQNPDLKGRITATQAADFVTHWQVISHQENTDSGFSATLFKNKDADEYVYACRGTEPGFEDLISADGGDIVLDGLAMKQIVDMYNDWQRITTPKGQPYTAAYLKKLEAETNYLDYLRFIQDDLGKAQYLETLRARNDIVIDQPNNEIYTIDFKSSTELFEGDDKALGVEALSGGEIVSGEIKGSVLEN